MTQHETTIDSTLPEREQEILDTALLESDQLLARSLHDDDQRRRRRRLWLLTLALGGVAMGILLIAIAMGWLTFAQPQVAEAARPTLEEVEQAETLSAEGWALWKKRDFAAAVKSFEKSVDLNPKDANAWNGYGWALFNGGKRSEAIKAFESCIKLSPKHPAGLNGLGQAYLVDGYLKKAEKYLQKAAPSAPAAWYGLTRVYLLNGDYKQAKTWAEKLVKQNPDDETSQKMLMAAVTENVDSALRKMIEPSGGIKEESSSERTANEKKENVATNDSSADFKRGWQMFGDQRYATAQRLFERSLNSDPDNPHAMNGLGWSLLNQGKHDEAKKWLEKCLTSEKEHSGALNGLAICLKAEGKVDEAIDLWERGYAAAPGPNALAIGLATTYLERNEYAKAAKYYDVLVEGDANNKQYQRGLKQARDGLAAATDESK